MLPDVGMVQMYSKSVAWVLRGQAGPPLCMDRPSSLFLRFFCQVVLPYLAGTHCTIPTSALVFGGNIFTPLFLDFLWNANCTWAKADQFEWLPNNSGNKGMCSDCMAGCVVHCGMWLGGQPRVGCGGWVQDVLLQSQTASPQP